MVQDPEAYSSSALYEREAVAPEFKLKLAQLMVAWPLGPPENSPVEIRSVKFSILQPSYKKFTYDQVKLAPEYSAPPNAPTFQNSMENGIVNEHVRTESSS